MSDNDEKMPVAPGGKAPAAKPETVKPAEKPAAAETESKGGEQLSGISRMSLELPLAYRERNQQYARDKSTGTRRFTEKDIIIRALDLYFEQVNKKENDKYAIQVVDNREIL